MIYWKIRLGSIIVFNGIRKIMDDRNKGKRVLWGLDNILG